MAIADGVLVDATQGDFADVSRQHFPDRHLAMTSAVFGLLENSVKTAECADFAGLWHDLLWMCRFPAQFVPGGQTFRVGIRAGRGLRWHILKIVFHGGDQGEPCATVMLPEED